jgi:RHS repeat-associated protein
VYIYDAIGTKLLKRLTKGSVITNRYYTGAFEYNNTKALVLIHTDEGMVNVSGTTYTYEYYLKDHLGNIRAAFAAGAATPSQLNDYYPFGMISNRNSSGTDNKYLYNGKEIQQELGLEWYDYRARFYDPQIGRFTTKDQLGEFAPTINPYQYCYNNPLSFIDPNGMMPEMSTFVIASTFVNNQYTVIEHRADGDPRVYLVRNEEAWRNGGSKKEGLAVLGFEDPNKDYDEGVIYTYYNPLDDPKYKDILIAYFEEYGYYEFLYSGINAWWSSCIYENPSLKDSNLKSKVGPQDVGTVIALILLNATDVDGSVPFYKPANFNPAIEKEVAKYFKYAHAGTKVAGRIFGGLTLREHAKTAGESFGAGKIGKGIIYSGSTLADFAMIVFEATDPIVIGAEAVYATMDITTF